MTGRHTIWRHITQCKLYITLRVAVCGVSFYFFFVLVRLSDVHTFYIHTYMDWTFNVCKRTK